MAVHNMKLNVRRICEVLNEQKAIEKTRDLAASAARMIYVYAMMDHTVAFGWCSGDNITLIVDGMEQTLNSLNYVRELRLFYDSGEFKVVRTGDTYFCRVLEEGAADGAGYTVYEETHKLWGSLDANNKVVMNVPGWCALTSDRGTCLYVPQSANHSRSRGLLIRSYIEFNPQRPVNNEADIAQPNLYRFIDERFVTFVDWHEGRAEA